MSEDFLEHLVTTATQSDFLRFEANSRDFALYMFGFLESHSPELSKLIGVCLSRDGACLSRDVDNRSDGF